MQTEIKQIYDTVQKLIGLHRQLLEAARLERQALREADLAALQDATLKKEGLLELIRQAEAERMRKTAELSLVWKKNLRELTFQNLILEVQAIDLEQAEQLRTARSTLMLLVDRIREQNEDNKGLIEKSLAHIQNMKRNVLGEAAPHATTYTAQGQRSTASGGARLLSTEV